MNETMILPISTSPPSQTIKPTHPMESSPGMNFEDVLQLQTENQSIRPESPARSVKVDAEASSSSRVEKPENPADAHRDEEKAETATDPNEGQDAPVSIPLSTQPAMPQIQVAVEVNQPEGKEGEGTPLEGTIKPQQAAQIAVQVLSPDGTQTQESASAPDTTGAFPVALQQAEEQTGEPKAASQPAESAAGQTDKLDGKSHSAVENPTPELKQEQSISPGSARADTQPAATNTKTTQPQPSSAGSEMKATPMQPTQSTAAEGTGSKGVKQEAPHQVQAPPGGTYVDATGTVAETTTITPKSPEPARLAEAQTTDILRQITRQMDQLSQSGRTTIRMQLSPQDLGQIELKITTTQQGVGVTLLADNASTGKMLETQVAQLRQNLADAGVQISNLQVGTQSNPQGTYGQSAFHSPTRFNGYQNLSLVAKTESSEEISVRDSLVDYKV